MALATVAPLPQYFDLDGDPLDGGKLYFGAVNQNPLTNPATVYWDAAATIPAAQPVRTVNGYTARNGTPALLYAAADYSVLVQDRRGRQVVYAANSAEFSNSSNVLTQLLAFITNIASSVGSSLVGFLQSGVGAVLRTVQSKLREWPSVQDYGAVGDGVADDHAAFAAAIAANPGKCIYVPDPPVAYRIATGTLALTAGTRLKGRTRRGTKLMHAVNATMFTLADGAGLDSLWLDGNGTNGFTGQCMRFNGTDGKQTISGVRATDWEDEVLYEEFGAGSQSTVMDCRLSRRNAGTGTNRFAIVIDPTPQLSAVPRKFSDIETDGQCAIDFGGCNDVFVSNAFLADLRYTADSRGVLLSNVRIANQAALTVNGHNNTMVGCDIAPQITLAAGTDAFVVEDNSYNLLPIIDNSGNGRNLLGHWSVAYTPTLTSGGVAPVLGNGTLTARASRKGATVTVNWVLTVGSTTNLGTGDLRIGLPPFAPNSNAAVQMCGIGNVNPSGAGAGFYIITHLVAAAPLQHASLRRDTSNSVTATSPGTFATGDVLRGQFSYMTD